MWPPVYCPRSAGFRSQLFSRHAASVFGKISGRRIYRSFEPVLHLCFRYSINCDIVVWDANSFFAASVLILLLPFLSLPHLYISDEGPVTSIMLLGAESPRAQHKTTWRRPKLPRWTLLAGQLGEKRRNCLPISVCFSVRVHVQFVFIHIIVIRLRLT